MDAAIKPTATSAAIPLRFPAHPISGLAGTVTPIKVDPSRPKAIGGGTVAAVTQ